MVRESADRWTNERRQGSAGRSRGQAPGDTWEHEPSTLPNTHDSLRIIARICLTLHRHPIYYKLVTCGAFALTRLAAVTY